MTDLSGIGKSMNIESGSKSLECTMTINNQATKVYYGIESELLKLW